MPSIAVQSWSLHRALGYPVAEASWPWGGMVEHRGDGLDLLELPEQLRRHGYATVQLCHFQLPTRSPAYLAELRAALAASGIALDALLLDTGDLSSPTVGDEVEAWVAGWIEDAAALGAARIRIVGGDQAPAPAAIAASATRFRRLAAVSPDVRLVTENWHDLLSTPDAVEAFLDRTEGDVGLLIDLGNWSGPTKYEDLARIARFAETCHAKCHVTADGAALDADDYAASLRVLSDAGFDGPLALVFEGPGDDAWSGMADERAIVRQVFPGI